MYKLSINKEKAITKFRANFKRLYKELEDELNINRKILSEMAGLARPTMTKMLNSDSPELSWFTLYCVAKVIGTSMESIIEGTYDINKIKSHLINIAKITKK
jgi:hypothetical protein